MEAEILTGAGLVSLLTLTIMEVVLGIDNIVFISIIASKLPADQQPKARTWGLILALIPRVILLLFITWIIGLDKPLFTIEGLTLHGDEPFYMTGKGVILLIGGLFLIYKATTEIHHKLEGAEEEIGVVKKRSFASALMQIVLINIVFSFDSILTAVGLADDVLIMIVAVVVSLGLMLIFAGKISSFVNKHPTVKMLALSFLLMIGVLLIAEAFNLHVPKGYVYFAMAFSVLVEMLNLRMRKKVKPVQLHNTHQDEFIAAERELKEKQA
ncbi:MAG: TerC family protein [Bacteroidota bacterium]|nr:TerC family protein [Bacteroidota bacterium]